MVTDLPPFDIEENTTRLEGLAAAWIADCVLRGTATSAADFLGETSPHGCEIGPGMVEHVQGYIDYVLSFGPTIASEMWIDIPHWGIRGRCDAAATQDPHTLRLVDLKYGWQIVEVEENTALLIYAIGLGMIQNYEHFELTIYQPRPYHPDGHVRTWKLTRAGLALEAAKIDRAVDLVRTGAPAAPGAHCGHCPRRSRCSVLLETAYGAYERMQNIRPGRAMSATELADALNFAKEAAQLVKAVSSGLMGEARARAKQGEYIPGYILDNPRGDRVYTVDPAMITLQTGHDVYERVLKSPAKLEEEGVPRGVLDTITTRPRGKPVLKPVNEKTIARQFK
jgi:hypothetical protein